MDSKNAYRIKMDIFIKEWDVRINELKEKAELLPEGQRTAYLSAVDDLAEKKERMRQQLQALETVDEGQWLDQKSAIDRRVGEVDETFRQALAHFK